MPCSQPVLQPDGTIPACGKFAVSAFCSEHFTENRKLEVRIEELERELDLAVAILDLAVPEWKDKMERLAEKLKK